MKSPVTSDTCAYELGRKLAEDRLEAIPGKFYSLYLFLAG